MCLPQMEATQYEALRRSMEDNLAQDTPGPLIRINFMENVQSSLQQGGPKMSAKSLVTVVAERNSVGTIFLTRWHSVVSIQHAKAALAKIRLPCTRISKRHVDQSGNIFFTKS